MQQMVSPDERPRKRQKEEEKAEVEQNGVKDDSPVVKQAKTEATKVEEGKQDKPSEVATDQALEDIGDDNEIGTTSKEMTKTDAAEPTTDAAKDAPSAAATNDNTTEEAESNNSAKPAGKPDEPQAHVSDTCVSSIEEEDETTVKTDPIEPESDEEDEENEKTLPIEEEGEESS